MKKKKTKVRITKWVLFISFMILLIRLIYASINAWNYQKTHDKNNPIISNNKNNYLNQKHNTYKLTTIKTKTNKFYIDTYKN